MSFWRSRRPRFKQIGSLRKLLKWCDAPSCPSCGYDLRGCRDRVGGPCPECGQDCRWSVLPGLIGSQRTGSLPVMVEVHHRSFSVLLFPMLGLLVLMFVLVVYQVVQQTSFYADEGPIPGLMLGASGLGLILSLAWSIRFFVRLRWWYGVLAWGVGFIVSLLALVLAGSWVQIVVTVILELLWRFDRIDYRPGHALSELTIGVLDPRFIGLVVACSVISVILFLLWRGLVLLPCRKQCARLTRLWLSESALSRAVGGFEFEAREEPV